MYLIHFNSSHTLVSWRCCLFLGFVAAGAQIWRGEPHRWPRQILWTSEAATSPRHIAWHEIIIMRYITLFHLVSSCFPKIKSDQQWSARSAERSLRLLSDMKPPWQRKNAVCVSMFAFHVGVVMYHNVSVSFHEFSIGLPSIYGSTNVATTHIAPERSERMRSIKMVFHHLEFMGNSWSHLSFRLEANREHVCNV